MGLFRRQSLENELRGIDRILIIDESIRIGQEKQLLILSTPFEKSTTEPLGFSDVDVHYFGGSVSWNGEQVSELVKEIRQRTGMNCRAILSDEDSKLKKASRLQQVPHLADICHAVGTCLKKTFNESVDYQRFVGDLSGYRSKGVNQDLSYLLPPKQGGKARFLNLERLVEWSVRMLNRFKNLSTKEQEFFKSLLSHREIIDCLNDCFELAKALNSQLKAEGLSKKTLLEAKELLEQVQQENRSAMVQLFVKHMMRYIADYQEFMKSTDGENIPVSSEIIESLFGTYKNLASADRLVGTTYLNFEIDVRCMDIQSIWNQSKIALESIFTTDLNQYVSLHSADNQLVRRKNFFKNRT